MDFIENIQTHLWAVTDIKKNNPKMYAMILKYLSDESLEEVQKVEGWSEVDVEVDPEC